MKVKDMTLNSLRKAILPTITACYFANRQKLDKGDSMEIVTGQVAAEIMKFKPAATVLDITKAFEKGAAGDYEENGQPPYLTPNKFRYFVKKYYEEQQTINARLEEEESRKALPYFSSWEERQIYHIARRYADTLKGWRVMMGDADILFRFFKKIGMATDCDYASDGIVARAKTDISSQPAADTPIIGVAKSIEARLSDYNEVAKVAKGIFIKDLMREWARQGLSVDDVTTTLRNAVISTEASL